MNNLARPYSLSLFISFFLPDAKENPYGDDDNKSPFPLQPKNKRSYAQNVTVWIKPSGLQVQILDLMCYCNQH